MNQLTISQQDNTITHLRVLIVEDSSYDAELVAETLREGGFTLTFRRVDTRAEMEQALRAGEPWNLILSDYSLPSFSGPEALEVLKESGQDIPFIIISGTVGEEVAVSSLKAGANDFLVKGQFSRLVPAVQRELSEVRNRKKARTFEKKFLATFEQAAVGIAHMDQNGNFLVMNRKYCNILGYEAGELMGLNFQTLTHPDDLPVNMSLFHQLLTGEIDTYSMEKRYIRKDDSLVWAALTVSLARDDQGRFDFAISVIEDITRRKQAEAELQRYALLLEQSNKELDEFATIASHDLQEPLRKVQIFSDILSAMVPAEGKDYIGRMQGSIRRMQSLITDLLALSRVNRKGQAFRAVDLNEVLHNVLDDMQIAIQEVNGTISCEPLHVVYADEGQIYQLFQNLISNALKYHQDHLPPAIKIHGHLIDDGLKYQIFVEDNGIGIAEAFYDRIFEAFQRLHGQVKYHGSGIGLTICKKIVARHNGVLSVESELDKGSKFSFTLPVYPPRSSLPKTQPANQNGQIPLSG